ncbi:hypothetical protein LguiA_017178 [Lonicera macranthoides]
MEVISQSSSTLNPNAPMFVPSAYRAVEDFSDQWWALVDSSPWFRDYWLQECFCDSQNAPPSSEIYDPFLSDIDALLDDLHSTKGEEKEGNETQNEKSVVRTGVFKWRKQRLTAPRYSDKAPKIVNVKLSPRPIQQPS